MTATLSYGDRFFKLTPLGYEFGDPEKALVGVRDARWLDIQVEAGSGDVKWKRVEPCLSDSEAADLVRWLRGLGTGDSGTSTFEGLEPSLQFRAQWAAQMVQLEVLFNLELHPDGRHHFRSGRCQGPVVRVTARRRRAICGGAISRLSAFPYPRP